MEAALIADMYADEFRQYNISSSRRRVAAGVSFLEDQASQFDSVLVSAESNILAYSEEEGVVDPLVEARMLLQQQMTLEAERYRTDFEIRAGNSEIQSLESEINRIIPGLSRTMGSIEDQAIIALKRRITTLQISNSEKLSINPDLGSNPQLDSDYSNNQILISDFTAELATRTVQFTEGLFSDESLLLGQDSENLLRRVASFQESLINKRVQLSGAQARMDVLDGQIEIYSAKINSIPNKAVVLARFQRDMDTSAQMYTTVFQSLQEARIAEESELGYVDIIDHAVIPASPVSPIISINLLLGAMLGVVFGVVVAFVRSAADNKIRTPEELRSKGFTLLGVLPNMEALIRSDFNGSTFVEVNGSAIATSLYTLLNPLSSVSEAFRRIRTNIDYATPDSETQIVLVTSAGPGEGKTVSSLNIAITMAQFGRKTLFMDLDMRRPTSHKLLDLAREPGFSDLIFDRSMNSTKAIRTDVENLDVLTVGKSVPNPAGAMPKSCVWKV